MKIVTHSGAAHADEIMAIALIAIKSSVPPEDLEIVRIPDAPTLKDLDGTDYVVDVGHQHDPICGRFDHHQLPADAPPTCAFTLVAEYFGYKRDAWSWMEKMAILDSKGPYAYFLIKKGRRHESEQEVKDLLGDADSVFSYFPRVANQIPESTTQFKKAVRLAYDWLLLEVNWIDKRVLNAEVARKNVKIVDLGGFKMAFFEQKDTRGTMEVCDELVRGDPTIILSGKLDERADGYSCMRLSDNPRVNFFPRAGEPGCRFAHANGFVMKYERNWEAFLDAIRRSVDA